MLNRLLPAIRSRPKTFLVVLTLFLLASIAGGFQQARRAAMERVELLFDSSRELHENHLSRQIETPWLVPEVLAMTKPIQTLLSHPSAAASREQNELLQNVAQAVRVDVLYLMDQDGKTLAASNWRAQDSFVGKNYKFRPYFQEAISGQPGRYIAKGVTSLKVGQYLSRYVVVDGKIQGVMVAKISFDSMQARLEESWRRDKELTLVTDENGIVVLSPMSELTFKTIHPIPESARKVIEASQQYGSEVPPLPLTTGDALSEDLRFVKFKAVPDQTFLQASYYFQNLGLRLFLHIPASRYWKIVAEFTAMFSLLALVVFLISISLFQRWVYAEKLIATAIRDPLTGLNTRVYMNDWCEAVISTHNRNPLAGIGLVLFDLDHFKKINDEYGHLVGDDVLQRVGAMIRAAIRGGDLAVRFGGEELAVFVRCSNHAEMVAFAERIRHRVEQTEFLSKSGRMPVTLSGGVAYHLVGETLDAFFARADKKLYEAKELGRNRVMG